MPKHLTARPPGDAVEERKVRKLAHSVHAPADWIFHAQIVVHSWDGLRTRQIAEALGCHPQTVRERLQAFNDRGFEGLGMKPGGGRKPRLTHEERSTILYLAQLPPPGKPTYDPIGELWVADPQGEVKWTLDALTAMAQHKGICVARSQIRRIFRQEGVRWRHSRLRASSQDADARPKRARIVGLYTDPPHGATVLWVDELGPVTPRNCPPAPGWSADGHRSKVPLHYDRGPQKVWVYGALRVRDGQALRRTARSRNTRG